MRGNASYIVAGLVVVQLVFIIIILSRNWNGQSCSGSANHFKDLLVAGNTIRRSSLVVKPEHPNESETRKNDKPQKLVEYDDFGDEIKGLSNKTMKLFGAVLSEEMRNDFNTLVERFDEIMTKANLTYFLIAGSLLGAYRFRDMIPWDDDIDIAIRFNQISSVHSAVENTQDDSKLAWSVNAMNFKFYMENIGQPVHERKQKGFDEYERRYPDLDIFLYRENSTHVWDASEVNKRRYIFKKSLVFPLKRMLFGNVKSLVPKRVRGVLARTYDMQLCMSAHMNHDTGESFHPESVNCKELSKKYRFYNSEYL